MQPLASRNQPNYPHLCTQRTTTSPTSKAEAISTLASLSLFSMATAKAPLIISSPDILGGTPVFAGTRVPVQTLIEYLEGGETIDDFLQGFPTVTRDQVIAFLEEAKARMLAKAS